MVHQLNKNTDRDIKKECNKTDKEKIDKNKKILTARVLAIENFLKHPKGQRIDKVQQKSWKKKAHTPYLTTFHPIS